MGDAFYIKKIEIAGINYPTQGLKLLGAIENQLYWTPASGNELILIKTDVNFAVLWAKKFEGKGYFTKVSEGIPIKLSKVLIAFGVYQNTDNSINFCILKIHTNGVSVWFKKYIQNNIDSSNFKVSSEKDNTIHVLSSNEVFKIDGISGDIEALSSRRGEEGGVSFRSISNNFTFKNIYSPQGDSNIYLSGNYNSNQNDNNYIISTLPLNKDTGPSKKTKIASPNNQGSGGQDDLQIEMFGNSIIFSHLLVRDRFTTSRTLISFNIDNNSINKSLSYGNYIKYNKVFKSTHIYTYDNKLYIYDIDSGSKATDLYQFNKDLEITKSKKILNESLSFETLSGHNNSFLFSGRNSDKIYKIKDDLLSNSCISFEEIPPLVSENLTVSIEPIDKIEFYFSPLITIENIDNSSIDLIISSTLICEVLLDVDPNQSTITANPTCIDADSSATSIITVILKDKDGTSITNSSADVKISTTKGSISTTTKNENGTYSAILTASSVYELAKLSFTINNEQATQKAWVRFEGDIPELKDCEHRFAKKVICTATILNQQS